MTTCLKSFALAACLLAPAATAQMISARDPQGILDVIQALGYEGTLATDSQGDPLIRSSVIGTDYQIYFYGCTDGLACNSIQFSAGYNLTDGSSTQMMNDWNQNRVFGQAFVDDDGDPVIRLSVNLDADGVSVSNFRDHVFLWEQVVVQFQSHINW